jgi:sporulation protein YlmC with PRC-barrel domain
VGAPRADAGARTDIFKEASMLKTLMITTAVGALAIGAANAQTSTAPVPSATSSAPASSGQLVNAQKPDQMLSSKFIGTDVIGVNDEKIGDVSDVLFDKDGTVHAYIVGVGGFLGIGAKDVALAPASFQLVKGENNSADRLRLSMTKDQLQQAAAFEPYNPASRTTTGSGPAGGMNTRPAGSTAPAR